MIEGREHINFSDRNRPEHQPVEEVQEVLEKNSMPPAPYLLLHPEARLDAQEKQKLEEGFLN